MELPLFSASVSSSRCHRRSRCSDVFSCPHERSDSSTVALVQMRCGAEPDENLERAIGFIRDAAAKGAQIVCLPELFRSQYFCQSEDHANFALAEEIPGPTTERLGELPASSAS